MSSYFFRDHLDEEEEDNTFLFYTQCQMRNYVTKYLWHLSHENSSETSIKHQNFLVLRYKASDDNLDKLYFSVNMFKIERKYMTTKTFTFLDTHRLSILA